MPSLIPILNIAPLFALYNGTSTPTADSSLAHLTVAPTSTPHSSHSDSETLHTTSTTTLLESPTPSLNLAPASPGTSLPIASSLTPTHVPFHVRPFSHLNIWAYLALAFLMLSLATIVAYCTYACYHSAKKEGQNISRKNGKCSNRDDDNCAQLNGSDEEKGGKSEYDVSGVETGRAGGKISPGLDTSESAFLPSNSQSYNMHQPTHQLHYNTSKDTEWPSASEEISLDSMVETNLKRFSEAEATCNFASGIKATSEHAPKPGAMRKPLKSSLKPSFLRSKTEKLQKRGSLKSSKKGVSFSTFRSGVGSINAGFRSVKQSGMRGLGIGIGKGNESDGSDACTEMIQLRTHHKHKVHTVSSHPSLVGSPSNPTCGSSSLECAGSITQSSSSAGVSSSHYSTHERSYAIIGSPSTNESSEEMHILHANLVRASHNPAFNHSSGHTNVETNSSPIGPFAARNSTYIPFHLRPPPPSPTPAHKQNVERQYAAYRRSKGFKLKPKRKDSNGIGSKGLNDSGSASMGREYFGAELELTHSPVSPSPSPSPSFVKPIGTSVKEGQRVGLGLALGTEHKRHVGKVPSPHPQSSTSTKNSAEPSFSSSNGVTYDAHNIRFAQPPPLPSASNGPNAPSIPQSPQMAMLWKEPKLSPISGEIITSFSGFSNSAPVAANRGLSSGIAAPLSLPISSPILSPVVSPSPSPTSATAATTSLGSKPSETGRPATPGKNKSPGRLNGLGFFKGNSPSRSPSPNRSPGRRNGLLAGGGGGFSLTPTMRGPPRLPSGNGSGRSAASNSGNGGGDGSDNANAIVSPEATRARMQTLKKLTTGG